MVSAALPRGILSIVPVLFLTELYPQVPACTLDILPLQLLYVAEPHACHTGEHEHLTDSAVSFWQGRPLHPFQLRLGQEAFLPLLFLRAIDTLQYPVIEQTVLVCVTQHAG